MKYCTYETRHKSGFYYRGKGITEKVKSGAYKGSGVRFKLALTRPGFDWDSWDTTILATYENESDAYSAEETLVPIELLSDPFCLNMHAGGLKGKYQNHSKLLKSINAANKKKRREEKAKVTREKKAATIAQQKASRELIRQLKKELKEK